VPSDTVENYLKQIYVEQQQAGAAMVQLGRLAKAMGVVPGTATAMVKGLADAGLVLYESRAGVRLTAAGARLALDVVRRHRLLELFLVQVLRLDWTEVHAEAEVLEHALSEKVLAAIDEVLGHPTLDPHGDPIPDAAGAMLERDLRNLTQCAPGQDLQVAQVDYEAPDFLRFVQSHGLVPGAGVRIIDIDTLADRITVEARGCVPVVLGSAAARRICVAPAGPVRDDCRPPKCDEQSGP
jgi:DtxR family Mn-dependent transcriptional regulator